MHVMTSPVSHAGPGEVMQLPLEAGYPGPGFLAAQALGVQLLARHGDIRMSAIFLEMLSSYLLVWLLMSLTVLLVSSAMSLTWLLGRITHIISIVFAFSWPKCALLIDSEYRKFHNLTHFYPLYFCHLNLLLSIFYFLRGNPRRL